MGKSSIENKIARGIIKSVLILIGFFILLYFLFSIRIIFIYLAAAAVLAIIGRPLVILLNDKMKLPSAFAAMITILIFLGVFSGLFYLFKPLIMQQIENLAFLSEDKLRLRIETNYFNLVKFLQSQNITILKEWFDSKRIMDNLSNWLPNIFNNLLAFLSDFFIGLLSVLFISFFLLKDRMLLKKMVFSIVPDDQEKHFDNVLDKTNNLLSRYFIGLIGQIFTMFVLYLIILLLFGVKNPFITATICAFFNLIPYIGPLIGSIIISLFSMSHFVGLGLDYQTEVLPKIFYILILYYLAQIIDNLILQPVIFSKSVRSHPLEIFFTIIIGGIIWGVAGMIVAVPFYTAIRVILKEFLGHIKWVKSITKNI